MGTCGCCSVLIDGEPKLSCMTLAVEQEGCEITTVEGSQMVITFTPYKPCLQNAVEVSAGSVPPAFGCLRCAIRIKSPPTREEARDAIEGISAGARDISKIRFDNGSF